MKKGSVTLVGAGPGDPGLLTRKGARRLSQADTVVYDRLVSPEILAMAPPGAEMIDVGKQGGNHPVPQEEISALLLQKAREGRRVVRLKGGDPFVFGRGGEELELLGQNGVPFEAVPGVTSAVAAPAYAGIPLTHRDYCSSFHVITGHARQGGELDIPYAALAALRGTLVFLMGVSAVRRLCAGLLRAGMDGGTPAAIVEKGTTPRQRTVLSTLAELPDAAEKNRIAPPAVILVGKVCALSPRLDWFTKQPLFGCRVAVTSGTSSAGALAGKLRDLGASVLELPCMAVEEIAENPALDAALGSLREYRTLAFTSKAGVEIFFRRLNARGLDTRALSGLRVAAVGSRTAEALGSYGLIADYVPAVYDALHLARGLAKTAAPGERVLLCRAAEGTPELPELLRQSGVPCADVPLYRTAGGGGFEKLLAADGTDYVTFLSSAAAEGFAGAFSGDPAGVKAICIGERTAAAARRHGFCCEVAAQATLDAVVRKLVEKTESEKRSEGRL